jgi:Leu/Phe-tRNA-protein transferase
MTYLNVPSPPIQIQIQPFDLTIFSEQIVDVFFRGLFVDVRRDDDPAFYAADGHRVLVSFGFAARALSFGRGRGICGWWFGVELHGFGRHRGGVFGVVWREVFPAELWFRSSYGRAGKIDV